MIELLSRYGGVPNARTPGYLRDTELAAWMFRQEEAGTLPKGTEREGRTVAEEILDPAASAGSVDILRMALERIAWAREDPRWWGILASPLCFWNPRPKHLSSLLRHGARPVRRQYQRALRHRCTALRRGIVSLDHARGTRGVRTHVTGSWREAGRAR
jgi:hypothetical protein